MATAEENTTQWETGLKLITIECIEKDQCAIL